MFSAFLFKAFPEHYHHPPMSSLARRQYIKKQLFVSSDAQTDLLCRGRVLYTLPDVFTEMCLSWIVVGSSCQGCNTYWPQGTNRPRPKLQEHPTISSSMMNLGTHAPETTTYLTQGGTSWRIPPAGGRYCTPERSKRHSPFTSPLPSRKGKNHKPPGLHTTHTHPYSHS